MSSTSSLGNEEELEMNQQLEKKQVLEMYPFHLEDDLSSDDIVKGTGQSDPFNEPEDEPAECKVECCRTKPMFKSHVANNWSRGLFQNSKLASLVRSADEVVERDGSKRTNGEFHTLPIVGCGRSDNLLRISAEIAAALLDGAIKRDHLFIDARYKYEYEGGHVRDAYRMENEAEMASILQSGKILIFYCEFSSVRGPSLALRFRNLDRRMNAYPQLSCPEIYILDGGYKNFYKRFPLYCTPSSYTMMHDARHRLECAMEVRKRQLRKR